MKFTATLIAILLVPSTGQCKIPQLDNATAIARNAEERLTTTPNLTPEETTRLREEKAGAVEKIESIANSEPKDTETQLEVSKSLASVAEAPRAIPYAERGLKLAETSGDPKMIREALLTGSEVYYKAGNYDLARARAERILKDDPKDKDAMALYMQVKGRGAAAAAPGAATGSGAGAAGRSAGSMGGTAGAAATQGATSGPSVAMTNAGSLEAQKQMALGWSRIKLDSAAALKNFEAAITADPKSASVRVQRSRARREAGDAAGALGDANDAIGMEPGLGEAYAARAEANRALGRAEADLLADYEQAAKLDGRFTDAYKTVLTQVGGSGGNAAASSEEKTAGKGGSGGASAPAGPLGLLARSPKYWGLFAFICAMLAAAGGIIVPLVLKKRRSGEDGSPPR